MNIRGIKRALALTSVMLAPFVAANTAQAEGWHGFYLGANAGYGSGEGDGKFDPLPTPAAFVNLRPTALDTGPSGAVYGLQAGYNFGSGHGFVWGVEADVDGSSLSGDETVTPIVQNNGTNFPGAGFLHASQDVNWLATLRARLGWEVSPNVLLYGTAGAAWADVESNADTDFRPVGTTHYPGSARDTKTGWAAGAGFDWRTHGNWSFRAEYLHVDLDDGEDVANASPALPPFQVGYNWETSLDLLRVGVNYHLGN